MSSRRLLFAATFVVASFPAAAFAQEEPAPAPEPLPAPAPAETTPPPAAPAPLYGQPLSPDAADAPRAEGPPRNDFVRIGAGLRMGYVDDPGFDTFSKNDVLPSFSLDGTITLLSGKKASLASGVAWDVGGRANGLRGLDASLTVHRLTVPIEGRYHIARGLYAFGRVAPGAAALLARVNDSSAAANLKETSWVFAGDLSLGASVLLGSRRDLDQRAARIWITPEVGWSLTSSADLRPAPSRDQEDVLGRDTGTNLGSVAMNGFFWRASIATTF